MFECGNVKPGEMARVRKNCVVGGTPGVQMVKAGEVVLVLERREKTPLQSIDVLLPNGLVGWLCESDLSNVE